MTPFSSRIYAIFFSFQESGRAGRDGELAECILFFSYKDKKDISSMISKGSNPQSIQQGLENLKKCVSYCFEETECRRVLLLQYFGENFSSAQCNFTCDNCSALRENFKLEAIDYTDHAKRLISLIQKSSEKKGSSLTIAKIAKIYTFSKEKEFEKYIDIMKTINQKFECATETSNSNRNHSVLIGKESINVTTAASTLNRETVEKLLQHLVMRDYLCEESFQNTLGFSSDYIALGENCNALVQNSSKSKLNFNSDSTANSRVIIISRRHVSGSPKRNKSKTKVAIDSLNATTLDTTLDTLDGSILDNSFELISSKSKSMPKDACITNNEESDWIDSSISHISKAKQLESIDGVVKKLKINNIAKKPSLMNKRKHLDSFVNLTSSPHDIDEFQGNNSLLSSGIDIDPGLNPSSSSHQKFSASSISNADRRTSDEYIREMIQSSTSNYPIDSVKSIKQIHSKPNSFVNRNKVSKALDLVEPVQSSKKQKSLILVNSDDEIDSDEDDVRRNNIVKSKVIDRANSKGNFVLSSVNS